jgi:hypothetical protein
VPVIPALGVAELGEFFKTSQKNIMRTISKKRRRRRETKKGGDRDEEGEE